MNWQTCWSIDRFSEYDQQCSNDSLALVFSSRPIKMSPRFVLGRENVPCVAEVVNRSLKADCTDFTCAATSSQLLNQKLKSISRNPSTTLWLTLFFYSMLSVNSKIRRFVKLILFAELALPSWLRHILYNGFDSSPPVTEVMIFIPTWPTSRWRMLIFPSAS